MNGNSRSIKLGYYNHGHYYRATNGEIYVSFDVAIWADRFVELCDDFVVFLNRGSDTIIEDVDIANSFYPLNKSVKLVDIGEQRPHWQKMFGLGLDTLAISRATAALDWIIIQGPTPQQNVVAKAVHSNCKIAVLLVGLWRSWPKQMYRAPGLGNVFKEQLINVLKWYNQIQTRVLLNNYSDLPMGNNPEMPNFYECEKPFKLVSKGLVKETELAFQKRDPIDRRFVKLVFFSRLDPEKNLELLLDAILILKQKGLGIELKVYGATAITQYVDFIQDRILQLGLFQQVELMGELPNHRKLEVFSDADIYVFNTCTTEGFPRTIWEAMATGIPIVCANYPGAETFLRDGEVRFFRQNDSQDLAAKIFEQVDLEENQRDQDSRKAQALLKKSTLEASTANIVDILSKQQ